MAWSHFLEELTANSERVIFSIRQSVRTVGTPEKAFDQFEGAQEDSTPFSSVPLDDRTINASPIMIILAVSILTWLNYFHGYQAHPRFHCLSRWT